MRLFAFCIMRLFAFCIMRGALRLRLRFLFLCPLSADVGRLRRHAPPVLPSGRRGGTVGDCRVLVRGDRFVGRLCLRLGEEAVDVLVRPLLFFDAAQCAEDVFDLLLICTVGTEQLAHCLDVVAAAVGGDAVIHACVDERIIVRGNQPLVDVRTGHAVPVHVGCLLRLAREECIKCPLGIAPGGADKRRCGEDRCAERLLVHACAAQRTDDMTLRFVGQRITAQRMHGVLETRRIDVAVVLRCIIGSGNRLVCAELTHGRGDGLAHVGFLVPSRVLRHGRKELHGGLLLCARCAQEGHDGVLLGQCRRRVFPLACPDAVKGGLHFCRLALCRIPHCRTMRTPDAVLERGACLRIPCEYAIEAAADIRLTHIRLRDAAHLLPAEDVLIGSGKYALDLPQRRFVEHVEPCGRGRQAEICRRTCPVGQDALKVVVHRTLLRGKERIAALAECGAQLIDPVALVPHFAQDIGLDAPYGGDEVRRVLCRCTIGVYCVHRHHRSFHAALSAVQKSPTPPAFPPNGLPSISVSSFPSLTAWFSAFSRVFIRISMRLTRMAK